MVYVVGIIGFIGGFALGQMILYVLLRERSRKELLENSSLKWTYGVLGWLIAGLGAYSAVITYQFYF